MGEISELGADLGPTGEWQRGTMAGREGSRKQMPAEGGNGGER